MKIAQILKEKREQILEIAHRHGVEEIRVFGSAARGELGVGSDVDFLIEVGEETPPWFPGGLVSELSALLGRRVDVVEASALRDGMRNHVLEEAVPF